MVLMQGTKRVLDKANSETSSSSTARTVTIYGVTSYNDITNCVLSIKSNAVGSTGINTLNVNNLGAADIKYFNNGVKSPIDISNWVGVGQIYNVYYDGTDFVLVNMSSGGGSSAPQVVYSFTANLSSLVAGSYTSQQLEAIIDLDFFDCVGTYGLLIYDSTSGDNIYEVLNSSSVHDSLANTDTFKFAILDGLILKSYEIELDISNNTYTVTITSTDLSLRNANNTQY